MNQSTFLLLFSLSICTSIFGMENDTALVENMEKQSEPVENDNHLIYPMRAKSSILEVVAFFKKKLKPLKSDKENFHDLIWQYYGDIELIKLSAKIPPPYLSRNMDWDARFHPNYVCRRMYGADCITFVNEVQFHAHRWEGFIVGSFLCLHLANRQRIFWDYNTGKFVHHDVSHCHTFDEIRCEHNKILDSNNNIRDVSHVDIEKKNVFKRGALTIYQTDSTNNSTSVKVMCNALALVRKIQSEIDAQKYKDQENHKTKNLLTAISDHNSVCQSSLPCIIL